MVINAFSKDYVKTYHPELLSGIRKEAEAKANGEKFGRLGRASRENLAGELAMPLSSFPKTKARVSIERTEFHIYSKAGMPKVVK